MKQLTIIALSLWLSACASTGTGSPSSSIRQEMDKAVQESATTGNARTDAVSQALLPPLGMAPATGAIKPVEGKFDLAVNNTAAAQVFMAIVSGTRYSMLVHPDVSGAISINLKDVTVFDALEAIKDLYGYDYKVDGTRIYIQPLTLQTRIYQVNYLTGQREGKSSLRVASGSVADVATGSAGSGSTSSTENRDSSKVTMTSSADFWDELVKTLAIIVGTEQGRSVVVSPMTGVIVVRAMPDEQRNVAAYLKASQLSLERQVILEAKIIEVKLSDTFQSGVNWAAFRNVGNTALSGGNIASGASLNNTGSLTNGIITATPGTSISSLAATALPTGAIAGSVFGLAFQTSNFAALLSFLEGQGDVHVLSSPRIATLNNQKAVLKVGTDEFYVTEVTGGTASTTTTSGTAPTVKVQPFFSGISLDVTPRIDENNEIILHVHPSVSTVSTVNKTLNLGTTMGTYNLPLASSSVSETDSVVRARDGQIVAIGGLMRQATIDEETGLPMLPKTVFGQTSKSTEKRELVILLKPTVVDSDKDWSEEIARSRDRINKMTR